MYTNADSLLNKMGELKTRVSLYKPKIICINEILPKHSLIEYDKVAFEIKGYDLYVNELTGRGLAMYIDKNLPSCQIYTCINYKDYVLCQIFLPGGIKVYLCYIYRSPNGTSENDDELCDLITEVCNISNDNLIIVGDFNYKEINWEEGSCNYNVSHKGYKLYDTINDHFLY